MQECPEEEQWLEEDEDGFLAQISTCFMQLRQECAADEQKDAKDQHSCIVFFLHLVCKCLQRLNQDRNNIRALC